MSARSPEDTLVHSYLYLRRAIGVIGTALPAVLIIGKLIVDGGGLQDSISSYFWTDMRGVFVGSMCAVGAFLLSYRGYDVIDDIAGNVAGVAAIGVGLFPTAPDHPSSTAQVIGVLHLVFAAIFFLTIAFFAIVLFRRTSEMGPTERKLQRNRLYLTCGIVIIACLLAIAAVHQFFDAALAPVHPELWLESIAVMSFGVAWLTKGEAILGDVFPTPAVVSTEA
ncbi:DUF998 domain-containing protein [Kutzneria buriramensis]|uniref:DUF998 domain-containing protein n=1 Tax=Kutzneria buriramensis TaxID=1045776 RepID=A0A3E0H1R2_9PSEU|nr:DUF998 domain-containing protein [Kutzneria buriramensis]REH36213.1 hypothetical protein BCF44_11682 [Kutzneria buriramensis]